MSDNNIRNYIQPNAFTVENDRLYCIDKFSCRIIVIKLIDGTIERLIKLPEGVTFMDDSRTFVFIYDGRIIFLSNTESIIYVWDDSKNLWETYELSESINKGFYLYSQGRMVGKYLHIFPFTGRNYIKFDLEKNKVEAAYNIFELLKKQFPENFVSINSPTWIDEGRVAGAISENNAIFIIDLETLNIEFKYFEKPGCVISTVAAVGDSLILCDKGRYVLYKVNKSNMEIQKEYNLNNRRPRITSINTKIFVLEKIDSDEFYILNENFETIYMNSESIINNDDTVNSSGIIVYGAHIGYYYNKINEKLYIVTDTGNVEEKNILRDLEFISLSNCEVDIGGRLFREDIFFGLDDFLSVITNS